MKSDINRPGKEEPCTDTCMLFVNKTIKQGLPSSSVDAVLVYVRVSMAVPCGGTAVRSAGLIVLRLTSRSKEAVDDSSARAGRVHCG